jgi:hypothetical protein
VVFRGIAKSVGGGARSAAVVMCCMLATCVNQSFVAAFDEMSNIENKRDYLRLCDLSTGITQEDIKEAKLRYLKDDRSGFTDEWMDMLSYVQSDELLSTIRQCHWEELGSLGKKLDAWISVTNRGCSLSSPDCLNEQYRRFISKRLLNAGLRIRGDYSAILDDISSALVMFAIFADSSLRPPILSNYMWKIPLNQSHSVDGSRKLPLPS